MRRSFGFYINFIFFLVLFVVQLCSSVNAQTRRHTLFFEGTDYELNVYRIYGKEPGKTMLLIGGIQGDEPGGFLSADRYADFFLARGNLIVVPRANFHSIVLYQRQINEDMNRKFAEDNHNNYESKVVVILKKLIEESDCLLNLHDGSGFFSEEWKSPDINPKKYGQSIIADNSICVNQKTGQTINLKEMAKNVIETINKKIKKPEHHFHFNNHKTDCKSSLHKEQRKSATYYALNQCGIPAFGIETSKSLPLEMKIRHHNLGINAFMDIFNIIPENPGINLDQPKLHYLVISVNDSLPIVVKDGQSIYINHGDNVEISHIDANYDRGLSADILGYGTINDVGKNITITGTARIVARKDYHPCGSVFIELGQSRKKLNKSVSIGESSSEVPSCRFFKTKINGIERIIPNFGHIQLVKGDSFEIIDIIGTGDPSDLVVNVKGYTGNPENNTGEDRGFAINTATDLWKRYSLNKKGQHYHVDVTYGKKQIGKLFLDFEEPVLNYLLLSSGDDKLNYLVSGDTFQIGMDNFFKLIDVSTNVAENKSVKTFMAGQGHLKKLIKKSEPFLLDDFPYGGKRRKDDYDRIVVERDNILLGVIYLNFTQRNNSGG
ncbi:MAG: hypothetical protein J7K84_09085 [Deltaproteobacteria bacterium]|nr:hypothetical protein [Deltaproteobacteria bacterium]